MNQRYAQADLYAAISTTGYKTLCQNMKNSFLYRKLHVLANEDKVHAAMLVQFSFFANV